MRSAEKAAAVHSLLLTLDAQEKKVADISPTTMTVVPQRNDSGGFAKEANGPLDGSYDKYNPPHCT